MGRRILLVALQVRCLPSQRSEVKDVVDIFGGVVAHLTTQAMTVEVIGTEERMQSLQQVLAPYGVLEVARTGRIALERESKVDSRLLRGSQLGRYV
jgi:acetolactate synthase I/III small subunit